MRRDTKSVVDDPAAGRVSRRDRVGASQFARLFRLVLFLQAGRFPNGRELAERCEVSRRTVYRDLEVLSAAGLAVRFCRARQGYQISRGIFLPPSGLTESEALGLLVLAREWPRSGLGDGLGLFRHALEGANKVAQGLPAEARARVLRAAEPFGGDLTVPMTPPDRQAVHQAILIGTEERRQLRLWYAPGGREDEQECTKFGIYRLHPHDGRWHLIGRSTLHRRVTVLAVPWVREARLTEDTYAVPPRFNLDQFLGGAWGVEVGSNRQRVGLRFNARVAAEVLAVPWHPSQSALTLPDGRVEFHFLVSGLDEIARWVFGFGDQVEVLRPPALRHRLHDLGTAVARLNRPLKTLPAPIEAADLTIDESQRSRQADGRGPVGS